ncbi:copper-translocating P-type ATPase [Methanobrevibacter arboriphilus]|jgi:Cu2+-exporting ATPase|uniref:Copper-translocating P-type ATPase n=1 Tax=Methanobrevibacter arboriphilus TaxID=39441 RepID=A0ACA8R5K9_METAZ|nr:heavy metal translocating P-type ATPase [Methanobrevibacter arboriphilus]BBL62799.1 copper-translocating P-type ATPase [Methanobrevibacter arboriphilus]GLI12041.1 copper-translocating P-type ATPase [Methanobrevibacter arboriphilus]
MDEKDNHNRNTMSKEDMGHENVNHKNMDKNHEHMNHDEIDDMGHEHMDHGDMGDMGHEHMGHDEMDDMGHEHMDHAGMGMMDMEDLKKKFWVSLILTIPTILLSPMMGMEMPFQISFPGSYWVVLVIGSIIYFYGGQPFFTGSKEELRNKKPAMMTLIFMGITVAYFYSLYSVFANNIFHVHPMVHDFFWELATLIDIMLLGHIIEMNSIMSAGSALNKLAKLLPKKAHKLENGKIIDVDIDKLKENDIVEARAGEKIPADGIVIRGNTSINESMVTGESKQITKDINSKVIGGSVNGEGNIQIKITGTGETSYLAQVQKLVSEAQKEQSKRETMADIIARTLFYVAIILGIISFTSWYFVENISVAFSVAVTVLVIACPHALGLAIPLVVARSTSIGANNGLLFRNRTSFERVKKLKYALMDKTGTLTEGNFKVTKYGSLNDDITDETILKIAAGLEDGSNHPLAIGILSKVKEKELDYERAHNTYQKTGIGLTGEISGEEFKIVSVTYLDKKSISYDKSKFKKLAESGNSISYILNKSNDLLGFISQGDEIKSESKIMIDSLKERNIIPVMLTGDNEETANLVAKKLEIQNVFGKLLPEDKEKIVKKYQESGFTVMMIGDGVNDAPSLVAADIGVAIGSGTDVAIDSADVILVKSNPLDIIKFLDLGGKTTRKMNENLVWGAGYNVIALPLAAGVLAPFGFMLNPLIGAVLMSLSTILVAINAMLLKDI